MTFDVEFIENNNVLDVEFESVIQTGVDPEKVYNEGYNDGYAKAESENPLQYIYVKGFQWYKIDFPEGFDFVLNLLNKPDDCNAMLFGAKGIKTATISCDVEGTVAYGQMFRDCTVEIVDLTKFKPLPTNISYFAYYATKLKTILGAFDLSQCTAMTSAFAVANALEDIEFVPNTIKININFAYSNNLTAKSIQSIIDGLADLTGQTAQTVSWHSTVINKLTTEQYDQIIAKNWNFN